MQRIMVIGGPGSGKSTLARVLGTRLDLPVVHMDPIYWLGDWVERSKDDAMQMARAAADQPAWVFEGNHSSSMEYRAERAEMIIFLDMPRPLRLWRVFWRSIRYWGQTRPDMGPNCPERFDADFLKFCWNYDNDGRLRALSFVDDWRAKRLVHVLRSRSKVSLFVDTLSAKNTL
ncbi:AAA family ATPase [Phaeobacter gallaeciensis]|uniref:AAA family ATPase n=2 Tax=Roseobacteraceae TaxID=2854170 RepID=A0A366WQ86_9RHOB|nr:MULTISPECIES: AAA family ATPase [Roseobacteraceae]MBT3141722.1 AAA family ATPase [Falsiruegeria litorea]MBT8170101.1 AAA family ATPase [Falsiruegeria litorea]RBW50729.1 AAA family ATPase [Phaeobacter gallaeciensis]